MTSKRHWFTAPTCGKGKIPCNGACVAKCSSNLTLEPTTCICSCTAPTTRCGDRCVDLAKNANHCGACDHACDADRATTICAAGTCVVATCRAGFANCDNDPATGCETQLGSEDHCLACGDRCVSTNPCTTSACDPTQGCITKHLPDGTVCGDADVCHGGACMACMPNGTCTAPTDCCGDQVCCDETCTDASAFTADTANCGACGHECPAGVCETATCRDGICGIEPRGDGEACADGHECQQGACVPITGDEGPASTAAGNDRRTILASYNFRHSGSVPYWLTAYRPRQFRAGFIVTDPTRGGQTIDNAGSYSGWDILPTINEGYRRVSTWNDWLQTRLNRKATLAIVWRGGPTIPDWLNAWNPAENVVVAGKPLPTFRKSFDAGRVDLGGVYNPTESPTGGRDTYWVLLAEADGKRAAAPPVPAGNQVPAPNQTCLSWLHDSYATTGPDGQRYPTWHHQIDPIHWCYFRHEHGSDPAHFAGDYANALGYVAAKHGMAEPHNGFKNLTFESNGARWFVTLHMGTAGLGRACTRFHTLDIAARNAGTSELLADLHLMADFGPSVENVSKNWLRPSTCPDQGAQASGSHGVRRLPTLDTGSIGYEPWRPDFSSSVVGLSGTMVINNTDPMVICNSIVCDQAVSTNLSGTLRFLEANGFTITAGTQNSGVFYTDPMGQMFVDAGAAGAVRQFIKPGLSLVLNHGDKCRDLDAWGAAFICNTAIQSLPTNREGSIAAPN